MYIKPTVTGYERDGTQVARRQLFLILMEPKEDETLLPISSYYSKRDMYPIRAIVRKVALTQCGHFMMGFAFVKGHRITLSGDYGADGLTKAVPWEVYAEGIELPNDLYEAWSRGGGWNGGGSEAPTMRKWALENLDKLYKVRKARTKP